MADFHRSLRLGDLLVEKGLITPLQLREAIEVQQNLQSQRFGKKDLHVKTELGEILVQLGFISRLQLHANLNWQRRLKATTRAMVFIAPLLTAACGGGGGGGAGGGSQALSNPNVAVSSSVAPVESLPKTEPAPKSSSIEAASSANSSVPGTSPSPGVSPGSGSTTNSSSSAISQVSTSSSSQLSLASSSSISNKLVDGSVQLLWSVPTQRENGDYLDISEIGGYELRYKLRSDSEYKTIRITDGFTDAYYFDYLKGDYMFEIATFDKEGLYSNFVSINPT